MKGKNMQKPMPKTICVATAPYNFVSLPPKMVTAPLNEGCHCDPQKSADEHAKYYAEHYKDYIDRKGKFSGHIDITLKTVTPCFVGGEGEGFFAPTGRPVIPGSTIRGMVKNLFKIITAGAMRPDEDFEERHLYFRDVARSGNYQKQMMKNVGPRQTEHTSKPGFLISVGTEYYIYPAPKKEEKIAINPSDEQRKNHGHPYIIWNIPDGYVDCHTGKFGKKKKHCYRISLPQSWGNWEKKRISAKKAVASYRSDRNRDEKCTILLDEQGEKCRIFPDKNGKEEERASDITGIKDIKWIVPCFYMEEVDKDGKTIVKHFGQGPYYRIPYDKSIGRHVPESVKTEKKIDFADAVFGRKDFWASRVFFEDAEIQNEPVYGEKAYSKALMEPKPTSYQLYLKQPKLYAKAEDWDSQANIRGYKLYWHRENSNIDWMNESQSKSPVTGVKRIQPVTAGSVFKGRIRFRHLSEEELGALLSVFHLQGSSDHDIVYKIGRGKSIGMGSVRMESSFFLEDEAQRYRSLFSAHGWQEGQKGMTKQDVKYCIHAFEIYRKRQFTPDEERQFERAIEELCTLMDWKNVEEPDWKERTAMMPIGERNDRRYKDRVILDDAVSFVTKHFKKDNR